MAKNKKMPARKSKGIPVIPDTQAPVIKERALVGAANILKNTFLILTEGYNKILNPEELKLLEMAVYVINYYHGLEDPKLRPQFSLQGALLNCMRW